ncbi:DEAD/DEAH box helicase [Psychroflexus halocasei]|nr:DEAD/DEAH box helicase [Psychroflexus halocasei]
MNTFESLGLSQEILRAIEDMGFESPSEVQDKTIPILLEEPTDIVALAQTGTGKTAAFGFPLIQNIDLNSKKTQGLILSPTRELCLQITNELKNYSKYYKGLNTVAVYGGASITDQAKQIKRGAQVIVATPGRMKDMIRRQIIDISAIDICVLDEADEMLNMGFYEDIKEILSHSPSSKSTWLYSATMPKEVSQIAKKFMKSPVEITVGQKNVSTKNVSHEYYVVAGRDRYNGMKRLVDANPEIYSVIFCRTKRDTQKVAEQLIEDGYSASAIHGDLSQNQRDLVMKSFRNKQIQMLVATDVAARGIDVDDITHVINYQLPDEIETYTHRSGRTGRAGKEGTSMVIITKSEIRKIRQVERIIGQKFEEKKLPSGDEICKVQLFHLAKEMKETSINNEIDQYIGKLEEEFVDVSKEELIKKFFSVEFTRFHNYYKNAPKMAQPSESRSGGGDSYGDETRFFINIGEKDGFNWMSLKDFLKETLELGRDGVAKVDVKNTFSFFNVDNDHVEKVKATFEEFKLNNRHVNVEITKDNKSGGGGGRGRKKSKGGGGRRDGKSGGFKGKSKGGNKNVKSSFERRRRNR